MSACLRYFRRLGGGREKECGRLCFKALAHAPQQYPQFRNMQEQEPWNIRLEIECDGYLTRDCGRGKKGLMLDLLPLQLGLGAPIARVCPSLRTLSLWDVPCVGDEGLMEIAKECHSLEKLDLCQCPSISSKGLVAIAERCSSLTSLTIESCSSIGNEGLQAIGRHCTLLQSVTIKDCPLVGDQGVATLLSSTPTKVKLHGLKITDFSLAIIGHYGKAITSLALSALQNVSQKGFWVMGNAQGLKTLASLTITSCRGTTDVSLEAVGKAKLLEPLRVCSWKNATGSPQIGGRKCNSNCGKLKVSFCGEVYECGMDLTPEAQLLSPCESLRSLSIRNCPGFGSNSLAMVGKLCPQLYQLDLSGLCGITDAPLLSLLDNSKAGLAEVNLSGCLNLSDEVVFALARLHGQTLQVLNLDGCRKITNASLVAVANSCTFLNDLDVSKCLITDSGLAALSQGVQINLQILSLSGCFKVSSKSVPSLRKLGKNLIGLNLQQCNGMSSSAIELLVEHLWRKLLAMADNFAPTFCRLIKRPVGTLLDEDEDDKVADQIIFDGFAECVPNRVEACCHCAALLFPRPAALSHFRPCVAALVIPPHDDKNGFRRPSSSSSSGAGDESYYLLSWKCRCGNKYFQP
nr:EIN3-binding F-box protein 1-like [Ipomoea batatas]